MKFLSFFLCAGCISFILCCNSCSDNESNINKQADILSFSIKDNLVYNTSFSNSYNQEIGIVVMDTSNLEQHSFYPNIEISKGSKIIPNSSTPIRFEKNYSSNEYEFHYVVVSKDFSSKKEYILKPVQYLKTGFENWDTIKIPSGKYETSIKPTWRNSNVTGLILKGSNKGKNPLYPISKTSTCHTGKYAIEATTKDSRDYKYWGMPINNIIGGIIWLGIEPNQTYNDYQYGIKIPYAYGRPDILKGFYKYTPGGIYLDHGKEIPGKTDSGAIIAVMFAIPKSKVDTAYLNDTNLLTDQSIVAKATIYTQKTNGYEPFSAKLNYDKKLDYNCFDYKIAIVFKSSSKSYNDQGAIGSTLLIDDVELTSQPYH